MAMNLRLSEADDRLLTEYARAVGLTKQQTAQKAIHEYVTSKAHHLEDLEDSAALAAYDLARARGEITYVTQDEAKRQLGIDR